MSWGGLQQRATEQIEELSRELREGPFALRRTWAMMVEWPEGQLEAFLEEHGPDVRRFQTTPLRRLQRLAVWREPELRSQLAAVAVADLHSARKAVDLVKNCFQHDHDAKLHELEGACWFASSVADCLPGLGPLWDDEGYPLFDEIS